MVVRWYPGQDPLEDAALSSLKQLLHGLVYTETGNEKEAGREQLSALQRARTTHGAAEMSGLNESGDSSGASSISSI